MERQDVIKMEEKEFIKIAIENIEEEIEATHLKWKGHFAKNHFHNWIKC